MKFLHSKSECLSPKTYNLIIWSFYTRNQNACPQKPIIWYVTCLYSEILPKIQVGGLKKLLPPWKKKFIFHVWDIQDTFYMCKKKKKFKGGPKIFFFNPPFPPTKKLVLQKKANFFMFIRFWKKKFKKFKAMPILWDIAENSSRRFKKIFTPLKKFFFFHVWDIWDTFYMYKKKKKN